jgi:pimeloyl-[acyl-carrier protein] methyl ester esterase
VELARTIGPHANDLGYQVAGMEHEVSSEKPVDDENALSPTIRLLLLPGMDGTGRLFAALLSCLPNWIQPEVMQYPTDQPQSYSELLSTIRSTASKSEPFALLAESFSTPLAARLAAEAAANLKALILCAGFVTSPLSKYGGAFLSSVAAVLFRLRLPKWVIRKLLVGMDAPRELIQNVHDVIQSVSPKVLSTRLQEVLNCDETTRVSHIQCPILYIQADQDYLVRDYCFEAFRQLNASITLARLNGPHLIAQRHPRAVALEIEKFLKGHIFRHPDF